MWEYSDPLLVGIEEDENDCILIQEEKSQPQRISFQPQEILLQSNTKGKPTKSGTRRYLIDFVHLNLLVSSYRNHFNAYSSGQKRIFNQLVSSLVWKSVYVDFFKEYLSQM